MRNFKIQYVRLTALLSVILLVFTSCAPQIELSSSWTNKKASVKNSPLVMVMVFGQNLANRQAVENFMVAELHKNGHKAVAALDVFKPDVQKYDSASMVNLLRENNIDMLLTNSIVNVTEKERYVEGTTEQVPVGTYATPMNPYYTNNYNSYYNYYNTYNYQVLYETRTTPGYTVTDVEVLIESNLFNVSNPELLWFGQSKSYTKEPSTELFNEFARIVITDIVKNNILLK